AYVGHDGLMDFSLPRYPKKQNDRLRYSVILACLGKTFFGPSIRETGSYPLLWTTGLMAPEAYILRETLDGWILREKGEAIRERAARAYHAYQKCGLKAALNLFTSGW